MIRPILTALLYASLLGSANAAGSAGLPAPAEIAALREGDMRKLVIHDAPRPVAPIEFETVAGETRTLRDSDGKIRIVNFWATWCAPCRLEKPTLDALQADLGGADFDVIAIATGRNSPEGIARFNAEVGVTALKTYLDPRSQAALRVGILGLPVSILLDRDGREIARLQGGADWNSASARAILSRLIESGR